jgi:hypothetical protein
MAPIKVAVLDDYQGISEPKFKALDPAQFEVTFFKDTLLPYNHPDTPDEVREQLVKRLEPFDVICMWCSPLRLKRKSDPLIASYDARAHAFPRSPH